MHGCGERAVTTTIRIDAWTNKRSANARSRLNHMANAQTKGDDNHNEVIRPGLQESTVVTMSMAAFGGLLPFEIRTSQRAS